MLDLSNLVDAVSPGIFRQPVQPARSIAKAEQTERPQKSAGRRNEQRRI